MAVKIKVSLSLPFYLGLFYEKSFLNTPSLIIWHCYCLLFEMKIAHLDIKLDWLKITIKKFKSLLKIQTYHFNDFRLRHKCESCGLVGSTDGSWSKGCGFESSHRYTKWKWCQRTINHTIIMYFASLFKRLNFHLLEK